MNAAPEDPSPCPGCGCVLPAVTGPAHPAGLASPACWAAYGETYARLYSEPELFDVRQLHVDAYGVQHPSPRDDRRAVQSVALHLMTLCAFLERDVDPAEGPRLHGEMARRPVFGPLDPPAGRGAVTVADVRGATPAPAHTAALYRWAQSAWDAWSAHHATVRGWLDTGGYR